MYITIVKNYIEYIRNTYESDDEFTTNAFMMQELLRQALCVGFGLTSTGATTRVKEEALKCADSILAGFDVKHWTEEYKKGVLESCMHCISLTTEKAGK